MLPFNHGKKCPNPTQPNPNLSYLLPPQNKKSARPVLFSQNNRDIQTGMAVDLYWLSVFITSKGTIVAFVWQEFFEGENSRVKRILPGKFQMNFLGRHCSERCFHGYFSKRCFISYHLIMRVPWPAISKEISSFRPRISKEFPNKKRSGNKTCGSRYGCFVDHVHISGPTPDTLTIWQICTFQTSSFQWSVVGTHLYRDIENWGDNLPPTYR